MWFRLIRLQCFDLDVNILGGSIETIGGQRVGQLHDELVGRQVEAALAYLRGWGLEVEVEQAQNEWV